MRRFERRALTRPRTHLADMFWMRALVFFGGLAVIGVYVTFAPASGELSPGLVNDMFSRRQLGPKLKIGKDDDPEKWYDKDDNPDGFITCKSDEQPEICRGFGHRSLCQSIFEPAIFISNYCFCIYSLCPTVRPHS